MDYRHQIKEFLPLNRQEESDKRIILKYIEEFGDVILTRDCELGHITSSAMIFNKQMNKVLMAYHNIFQSWSWTGGHADGEKDLLHVAVKEAKEETGVIHIKPLQQSIVALDILTVWGHEKRGNYVSAHLHLNATYPLVAEETDVLITKEDENSGVRWLEISNLDPYIREMDMIPVYKKIINRVLQQ